MDRAGASVLKLNVLSVPEDPREFSADLSGQAAGLEADLALTGPLRVTGSLYRLGNKVFFRGRASARCELVCSRCLLTFAADLSAPLDLVAVPTEDAEAADREEESAAVVPYHGDQVDLAPEVRTAVVLALPMKPLCVEDCPGLCPECGERLNADGRCTCRRPRPSGPFAVLDRSAGRDPQDPGIAPGSQQEE